MINNKIIIDCNIIKYIKDGRIQKGQVVKSFKLFIYTKNNNNTYKLS